jgi:hypothetical protein
MLYVLKTSNLLLMLIAGSFNDDDLQRRVSHMTS